MRLVQCRGCQALIGFVEMRDSGKAMPVDPERRDEWIDTTAGKAVALFTLVTPEGQLIMGRRGTSIEPNTSRFEGYVPHWATCPKAKEFRRP